MNNEKMNTTESASILINILNGMDAYIYVSDPVTDEILFVNDKMKAHFTLEGEIIGKVCWQVFQDGFTERCRFCPNAKLLEDKDATIVWEEYNTLTKHYYKNSDKLISWVDGRLVHMQHSMDITLQREAEQTVKKRLEQQNLMSEISQSFISMENTYDFFRKALTLTSEFTRFDRVMLELLDKKNNVFYSKEECSTTKEIKKRPRSLTLSFNPGSKLYELLISRNMPYISIPDINFDKYPDLVPYGAVAFLILPIKADDKIVGLLEFHNCTEPYVWTESDIQLGYMLTGLFSGVISREKMKTDLHEMKSLAKVSTEIANTDYLSKLMNRRAMDKFLSELSLTLGNSPIKNYIFMLDIDNFKNVNDSYGHEIGDIVLVKAAQAIKDSATSGSVARWGGEEFLVSINADTKDAAIKIAGNILKNFSQIITEVRPGVFLSSTISCGVSEMIPGEAYVDAVARADSALYQAKKEGKNCVRYAEKDVKADNALSFYTPNQQNLSAEDFSVYSNVMVHVIRTLYHSSNPSVIIDELLKIVTIYVGLDRAYLFEKTDNKTLTATHRYDPENTGQEKFEIIPLEKEGQYKEADLQIPRFLSSIEPVMESINSEILPVDLQSYVRVPVYSNGEFGGVVRFDYCREAHNWTLDERRIFEDLTVFLGEAITRRKLKSKLDISQATLKTILDSIDDIVYVTDLETKELLFANKTLRNNYGENIMTGHKRCWEVLRPDIGEPCPFCQHCMLVGKNAPKSYRHDLHNSLTNRWFDITDTLVDWENGRKAVVMVCRDITNRKKRQENMQHMLSELEKQKTMHDFAMEKTKSFLWQLSADLQTLTLDDSIFNILGYEPEYFENSFEKFSSLFLEKEKVVTELNKYILGETDYFSTKHNVRTANGEVITLYVRGEFFDLEKTVIYGIGMDMRQED